MPCSRVYHVLALGLLLTGCVRQDPLLPALPAERHTWIDEAPGFATPDQIPWPPPSVLHAAPSPAPGPSVQMLPTPLPPVEALPPAPKARGKGRPVRLEPPERIIGEANKEALITPRREGYFGGRAEQRYIYQPGKIYLVVSSPNHPTTLLLPPGERLAAPPVVNSCTDQGDSGPQSDNCWVVGATEMGAEGTHIEAVILRPAKAGLESTMPLLTQGGRAYYIRLRSQEAVGMVAVTWELPTMQRLAVPEEPQARREPPSLQTLTSTALRAPVVNLERLHTAYTIEVVSKQRPPWVPVHVFDDGSRCYIRFKEALGFTAAPAVFGVHSDRSPALVEFTPYQSPAGGLTYIVNGLHPLLVLRGTDNMEVKITRGPLYAR